MFFEAEIIIFEAKLSVLAPKNRDFYHINMNSDPCLQRID